MAKTTAQLRACPPEHEPAALAERRARQQAEHFCDAAKAVLAGALSRSGAGTAGSVAQLGAGTGTGAAEIIEAAPAVMRSMLGGNKIEPRLAAVLAHSLLLAHWPLVVRAAGRARLGIPEQERADLIAHDIVHLQQGQFTPATAPKPGGAR